MSLPKGLLESSCRTSAAVCWLISDVIYFLSFTKVGTPYQHLRWLVDLGVSCGWRRGGIGRKRMSPIKRSCFFWNGGSIYFLNWGKHMWQKNCADILSTWLLVPCTACFNLFCFGLISACSFLLCYDAINIVTVVWYNLLMWNRIEQRQKKCICLILVRLYSLQRNWGNVDLDWLDTEPLSANCIGFGHLLNLDGYFRHWR